MKVGQGSTGKAQLCPLHSYLMVLFLHIFSNINSDFLSWWCQSAFSSKIQNRNYQLHFVSRAPCLPQKPRQTRREADPRPERPQDCLIRSDFMQVSLQICWRYRGCNWQRSKWPTDSTKDLNTHTEKNTPGMRGPSKCIRILHMPRRLKGGQTPPTLTAS